DAVIATSGITVTHSAGANDSINSLDSQAAIALSNGTLSIASGSTISDSFTLSGGTLDGAGTVTVTGSMTWTGGAMTGSGSTEVEAGLTLGGGDKALSQRTLNNHAAAVWNGGRVSMDSGATFNNLAGAGFDIQSDSSWTA